MTLTSAGMPPDSNRSSKTTQYIQDGTLQSAIIVTGGALNGFHVDELLRHLLNVAFARGPHHAATTFLRVRCERGGRD
jgi:hypothetical protein